LHSLSSTISPLLGLRLKTRKVIRASGEVIRTKIALGPKFQRIVYGRSNDLLTRSNKKGSVCLFLSSF
ncbi:hypothetical protein GIB67_010559, partial [Kingdonia uniflora]